ncbi:hypothetical protein C7212DRAFT_310126, partial [Tuber magnatum]
MVFPGPLPVTHTCSNKSRDFAKWWLSGNDILQVEAWLDTRYELETSIIRLYKKNKTYNKDLEKVK